ncbi:ABC transporter permease [Paraliobacillus sp. PM-2]|uniref:ABC transporter permease n=1 Tax=Paraliobacillus sp. PM-2 TaxID=1462524 RepID=UPI000B85755D|nr:ABC transporter permease [Paraliobacillus sp. PM-2]
MVQQIVKFIVKKGIKLVSLLIVVSVFSYLLLSYSPIDPVQSYIGADMTRVGPEQRAAIAEYWGLNEPIVDRLASWGLSLLQGDFGTSAIYRAPVLHVIGERFLASLTLMGLAWILSGLVGFVIGIIAGIKQGTWVDKLLKGYCYLLASTPTFWLGLMMLMLFSVWLGWFPIGLASPAGILAEDVSISDKLNHLILPVLTLSIIGVSNIALHTRQKLIDTYNSDFIRYAVAKGIKGHALLFRHALRNISLPAISLHFASFGEIFGGAILAEQVFSYPGLGQAVVQAGLNGDVPLLLGIVLFSTIFVFFGNTLADVLYVVVDPRIRREDSI